MVTTSEKGINSLVSTSNPEENKDSNNNYCIKILKNLYGKVQSVKVWYQYLTNKLKLIGFKLSLSDE